MFRRSFLQATAIAAALAFTAQAQAADLTVGANIGNVPWEFQDDSGAFVGFEIDLATEIAARLGRDLKLENIPFNGLFSAVQSGRIDMAMSSITITQKRLAEVSFAQAYYDSDQSLTVTAASGLKGLADMSGKIIGVDTGSTGDMWATENQAKYGLAEIRRYEGLAPAMLDLVNGRVDGYISDIPALQYYAKDKPELLVAERILTGEQYSMMFAKDAPLAAEVSAILTTLKQEGFVAATHKKWFGADPEPATSTATVLDMPKLQ
ncbi:ABC transporter substrate-binding protein [Paracoccaceae bacterium Fryx2]|nr:ABC transporter substrate-binding protein [Paracoccaceae bacterium Fryx2]